LTRPNGFIRTDTKTSPKGMGNNIMSKVSVKVGTNGNGSNGSNGSTLGQVVNKIATDVLGVNVEEAVVVEEEIEKEKAPAPAPGPIGLPPIQNSF
jgi:hypothetical protein